MPNIRDATPNRTTRQIAKLRVSDPYYAPATHDTRQPGVLCASDGWYAPNQGIETWRDAARKPRVMST
jgi:hypothetical protein